jgi:salicylate hydroxylase
MAVEDGTVVGYLLGQLNADFSAEVARSNMHSILHLYEKVRKSRTTVNVQGAVANRTLFHMVDGPEQEERDQDLRDPSRHNKWQFTDEEYQESLLGFDVTEDTRKQYALWKSCQTE